MNEVKLIGLDDLEHILNDITPRNANNLMRATIGGIAGEARKEIKQRTPVGVTGNLKESIKVVRRRSTPANPIAQVIADRKKGGWIWRFIEHGTGGENPQPARPFVKPSVEKILSMLPAITIQQFGKKLEAALKKQRKKIDSGKFE